MQLDPSKIQALQDLPTPNSQTKLQFFLGLINYLQPFIPSLSTKQFSWLNSLLHGTGIHWQMQHSSASKAWICQTLLNTTLAYYDRSKPFIVQTDASEFGQGAALIQSGYPIAFASKIFTDVETHCANIEQECLSVCFGLKKFHTYIYGRHVMVQNDHKPLEMIQQKPIHVAPPEVNRCFWTCRSLITLYSISLARKWC